MAMCSAEEKEHIMSDNFLLLQSSPIFELGLSISPTFSAILRSLLYLRRNTYFANHNHNQDDHDDRLVDGDRESDCSNGARISRGESLRWCGVLTLLIHAVIVSIIISRTANDRDHITINHSQETLPETLLSFLTRKLFLLLWAPGAR